MDDIHVVIGRGPLGKAVSKELLAKGKTVRMIGISPRQSALGKEIEECTYDVSQKNQAREALQGAKTVYQCSGPPYSKWTEKFPDLIEGVIEGTRYNNAKLVVGDNLYMYGDVSEPLKESLPYKTATKKGIVRAKVAKRLLNDHTQGEIEMTIGRGSDFFGPHVLHSSIGRVFPNIVKGKKAAVIGNPDQPHTYTFIEDFGKALVILGENKEALGQIWHVPNAQTITTRQFLNRAYEEAGYQPRIKPIGRNLLKIGGIFNSDAREMIELLYQFEKPFIVNNNKFVKVFGDCSTPFEESLKRTVSWFKRKG